VILVLGVGLVQRRLVRRKGLGCHVKRDARSNLPACGWDARRCSVPFPILFLFMWVYPFSR
jgi:hypothetical protein